MSRPLKLLNFADAQSSQSLGPQSTQASHAALQVAAAQWLAGWQISNGATCFQGRRNAALLSLLALRPEGTVHNGHGAAAHHAARLPAGRAQLRRRYSDEQSCGPASFHRALPATIGARQPSPLLELVRPRDASGCRRGGADRCVAPKNDQPISRRPRACICRRNVRGRRHGLRPRHLLRGNVCRLRRRVWRDVSRCRVSHGGYFSNASGLPRRTSTPGSCRCRGFLGLGCRRADPGNTRRPRCHGASL